MPFAGKEYLGLAQSLQELAGSSFSPEAAGRSAVSRAYYAAFCTVRNYAEANLHFTRTGRPEDHKALIECLKGQGGVYLKVANKLQELRNWRNRCDYDDEVPNLAPMVNAAITFAQDILAKCQ